MINSKAYTPNLLAISQYVQRQTLVDVASWRHIHCPIVECQWLTIRGRSFIARIIYFFIVSSINMPSQCQVNFLQSLRIDVKNSGPFFLDRFTHILWQIFSEENRNSPLYSAIPILSLTLATWCDLQMHHPLDPLDRASWQTNAINTLFD